ncbi:MAG: GTP 3',8-cyclase MoaA [Desulfobacteraceae bacterium]|nr:GTP 3',8-cyclase MoaA [Desulfobacteraceae bacterium]
MQTKNENNRLVDAFNRCVSYLRISITDRCNLKCRYCAPYDQKRIDKKKLLTLEEIERLVSIGTSLGITKVRLTGGEPLVRQGAISLVQRLNDVEGLKDLSLTTNGTLLTKYARGLKQAGLKRLNISLDTFNREKFRQLTGHDSFPKVWDGIQEALKTGFDPIKINSVVMKGYNDDEIEQLAALTLQFPFHVRFIEYMPIGAQPHLTHPYFISVVEIEKRLSRIATLIPIASKPFDGPAKRFRFKNAKGEIGLIGSMSTHFCGACNRLRLTATGHLRPCLLADEQIDLRHSLRQGATDEQIESIFLEVVSKKKKQHRISFTRKTALNSQMVNIGG